MTASKMTTEIKYFQEYPNAYSEFCAIFMALNSLRNCIITHQKAM